MNKYFDHDFYMYMIHIIPAFFLIFYTLYKHFIIINFSHLLQYSLFFLSQIKTGLITRWIFTKLMKVDIHMICFFGTQMWFHLTDLCHLRSSLLLLHSKLKVQLINLGGCVGHHYGMLLVSLLLSWSPTGPCLKETGSIFGLSLDYWSLQLLKFCWYSFWKALQTDLCIAQSLCSFWKYFSCVCLALYFGKGK